MDARIPATPPVSGKPQAAAHPAIAYTLDSDCRAAQGDDDLMSQPPEHAIVNLTKGAWRRHVGRAKKTWSKLAGLDLVRVDGDMSRLADLLRRSYSFGDAEIDRQISRFLGSKG